MFLNAETSSPIDLAASTHLKTFLADDKPGEVSPELVKTPEVLHSESIALDDNDFSMEFD
jgi:hypothetical protein